MSFQAYLDNIIKHGPTISKKHVGTAGSHNDDTDTLWLDGAAARPR